MGWARAMKRMAFVIVQKVGGESIARPPVRAITEARVKDHTVCVITLILVSGVIVKLTV
jgi:hypothetical protein